MNTIITSGIIGKIYNGVLYTILVLCILALIYIAYVILLRIIIYIQDYEKRSKNK